MKRGLALMTMAAILGMSVPFVYAATQPTSTYTVQSGDTLWKISQSTRVSIAQLEQTNNITNPNSLQVGQLLVIPATATGNTTTYTVKSGDTLWGISQSTGVSVQGLTQANGLTNPDQLAVGQVLKIPVSGGATSTSSTASPTNSATSYIVKSGDTLSKIAQATGFSVAGLVAVNHISNPNYLYVGEILILPPTGLTIATSLGQNLIVNDSQDNPAIKVVVTDAAGRPAMNADVSAISANTNIAQMVYATPTDNNGVSYVSIKPGSSTGTTTITISCDGVNQTIPVTTVNQPKTIVLNGAPGQIVKGTNDQLPFSVKVEDANGAPLTGIPIMLNFVGSASLQTTTNGAIVTDAQGEATFNVVQNGGSTGSSFVSATVPGGLVTSVQQFPVLVVNTAQSTIAADPVAMVKVSTASSSTIGIGQPMQINVSAVDPYNNPVTLNPPDVQYHISALTGSIDAATGEFTAQASGQYYISASVDGIDSQQAAIVYVYGTPAEISLGPSTWQMVNDPNATQSMHIQVTDNNGLGVPNLTVSLTSDKTNVATTSSQTVTTDSSGYATVSLVPGTTAGTAHITATVNGSVTATATVQVLAQPSKITVTADSPALIANSNQQTTVHVVGTNADGSPAAFDVVKFTETPNLLIGWTSGVQALAGDGTASVTVSPVGTPGTVTLTASIGQVSGSTMIVIIPGVDASHSSDFIPLSLQLGKSNSVDVTADDATGKPVLNLNYQAFKLVLTNGTQSITVPASNVTISNNGAAGYTPVFTPTSQGTFTSGVSATAQLYVNGVAIGTPKSVTLL